MTFNQRPRIHKSVGYEQEHGALQMFVPNGVCIYLALEKSYCMPILRIPAFSPPGLYSQRGGGGGGGGSRAPRDPT